MREVYIKRKTQVQVVADLKKVLPNRVYSRELRSPSPKECRQLISSTPRPFRGLETLFPTPAIASISKGIVYETPTNRPFPDPEDDDDDEVDDDDDNDFGEEDVQILAGKMWAL